MRVALAILLILLLIAGGAWGVGLLTPQSQPRQHRIAEVVKGEPINSPLDEDAEGGEDVQGDENGEYDGRMRQPFVPNRPVDTLPPLNFEPSPEHAAYLPLGFDRLSSFPYRRWWPDTTKPLDQQQPPDQFPPEIRALNGRQVAVVGFLNVLSPDEKGRASNFMLMRNQLLCCFGAPLTLQDWVDVKMKDGQKITPMLHVPVFVLGTLEVGEENVDGYTMSIYRLKADKILPPGVLP